MFEIGGDDPSLRTQLNGAVEVLSSTTGSDTPSKKPDFHRMAKQSRSPSDCPIPKKFKQNLPASSARGV